MTAAAIRPGLKLDATGFAIAILAHAALLYILTRERAEEKEPEPAAMEVSFVEETGPVSSAPVTSAEPAPTFGEEASSEAASGAEASEPAPITPPVPEPVRPPVETGERRRPDVTQNRVPVRPAPPPRVTQRQPQPRPAQTPPQRPVQQTQTRPAQPRPGPRGPSFADVARNVGGGAPSRRQGPPAAAPVQLSGAERQQIARQIGALIQPCSARARPPNELARSISLELRVTVNRSGVPTGHSVISTSGVNATNEDYVDNVTAAAMGAVRACASRIATLPDDHYAVAGGWQTFRYRFRFP